MFCRALYAPGKQCWGSGLREFASFSFWLLNKCTYVCTLICMCIYKSHLRAPGRGVVLIGRSWSVWSKTLGGEVLLGDGDSSVWQSGILILGVDHMKWYLTVKQDRYFFPLLTFHSE